MYSPSLRRRLFPLAYCSSGMARYPLSTVQRVLIAVFPLASASSGSTFFRYRHKQTRRRAPPIFQCRFLLLFFSFRKLSHKGYFLFHEKGDNVFLVTSFFYFSFFPGRKLFRDSCQFGVNHDASAIFANDDFFYPF